MNTVKYNFYYFHDDMSVYTMTKSIMYECEYVSEKKLYNTGNAQHNIISLKASIIGVLSFYFIFFMNLGLLKFYYLQQFCKPYLGTYFCVNIFEKIIVSLQLSDHLY